MLFFRLLGFLWLACFASAAYVQWQHCDATLPDDTSSIPQSLSAKVKRVNATHDRLSLGVVRWVDQPQCEPLVEKDLVATLDLQMFGHSSSYQLHAEGTCGRRTWSENISVLELTYWVDIGAFHPLSTAAIAIHLDDGVFRQESCVRANVTPQIDKNFRKALVCVPLFIFIFVLIAGSVRTFYGDVSASDNDGDNDEEPEPQTILPHVGDCLSYLQFIFLTGSLTLFYPGFYQPAVSYLSPYSLFLGGTMIPSPQYDSVRDGIYMVNGTYGGTFGLEVMTQVVGAPFTWGTWMNMVITIAIIAFVAAGALEIYRATRSDSDMDERSLWTGLRHTSNNVFRGIMSYFLFPLVALTCYQLDNAATLPAYHIASASLFIAVILAMFIWLLRQIPTRNLGILIFDTSRRYRQIASTGSSATVAAREKNFVLGFFLLIFMRGVVVGGLQISAVAQLVVLALCETVLLAFIMGFQAYSMLSVGATSAVARLASVLLMIAFIPGLASENVKAVVGYALLLLHTCMLFFGFLIPAGNGLVKLYSARRNCPRPNVSSYT